MLSSPKHLRNTSVVLYAIGFPGTSSLPASSRSSLSTREFTTLPLSIPRTWDIKLFETG